jgi:hypothetical protein
MKIIDPSGDDGAVFVEDSEPTKRAGLIDRSVRRSRGQFGGAVVGKLLAVSNCGHTAFVCFPNQPGSAAIKAQTTMDLHASHIGRQVALVFEDSNPARPIIVGVVSEPHTTTVEQRAGIIEVEADGARLLLSAREELVLRCGEATIILTKQGEVVIRGTSVSTHASDVNRIKGGSVQIN